MGDLERPGRRQASSSRRSSTHRIRPRAKPSTASLYSAGRPQENTTFTSFEPFSPPTNITSSYSSNATTTSSSNTSSTKPNALVPSNANANASSNQRDDASIRSYSSSKRSRSIYAPDCQNSLVEDSYGEVAAASSGNETEAGSEHDTRPLEHVSAASHSLINVLNMAPPKDDSRPPLFNDANDQQWHNPHVLQSADDKTIVIYVKRQGGAGKVIRRLAKDVSDRDAEISRLRRKVEEFGTLFKDHLMLVHEMSRLDADRVVRDSPVFTKAATNNLHEDLESASSDNLFGDSRAALAVANPGNSQESVSPLLKNGNFITLQPPSAMSTIRASRTASRELKADT
jgi:hypothetical protein